MAEIGSKSIKYNTRHAWMRAGVYFGVCLVASSYVGIFERLISDPLVTESQRSSPWWLLATVAISIYVVFAYGWFWPKGTTTRGRPRRVAAGVAFGFGWGFCQGQLALVVFELIAGLRLAMVPQIALVFLVWSAWTALWHARYWDIKVAPDHNIEEWNLRKILVAHAPFLLLSVTHYAIFQNVAIFVAWQIIALITSTLVMRFPAPGDVVVSRT